MKKYLLPATSILFIILISAYPTQSLYGAQYGLSAFLSTVMPALLPFFAATTILVRSGACDWIASLFSGVMRIFRLPGETAMPLVVSLLSGYPAGAKAVSDLRGTGRLSESQAHVAYVLCSTTGPAFILGTIGVMISANCGIYIMIPHYLSAIVTGIIAGIYLKPQPLSKAAAFKGSRQKDSAADIVVDAISSTASGLWRVATFMMFFSSLTFVLSGLGVLDIVGTVLSLPLRLLGIQPQMGSILASGIFEMTTGCISAVFVNAGYGSILPIISFIISFGGLSIVMQIFTFASASNVKFGYLFSFKLLQGVFSMLFTSVLLLLLPQDIETFNMSAPMTGNVDMGLASLFIVAALPLIFTFVSMLRYKGYRKRRV